MVGNTTPLAELLPALRADGVRSVSPTGVLGDPTGASAEEGAALLGALVERLVSAAGAWEVDGTGRLLGCPQQDHGWITLPLCALRRG